MKELYSKLYDDCCDMENFTNESHFVAIKGQNYDDCNKKVMIIGRATNAWKHLNASSRKAFGEDAQNNFANTTRWNWIECKNGGQYLSEESYIDNLKDRYCVSNKPFWSYSKAIWSGLTGQNAEDLWQENIAWSNLYKVSPSAGYNPSDDCAKIQQGVCIEILKKEFETLQPDYVIMMTGYEWFSPFASVFDSVNDIGNRNVFRGKRKNEVFVEATATYGKSKVVIACRPEMRDKQKYVEDVLRACKIKV